MNGAGRPPIEIGLNAAIVAVADQQPLILVVSAPDVREPDGLPFGTFDPLAHRTFEMGLRAWVEEQTALKLGYAEQLYTFGDRGRHARPRRHGAARRLGRLSRADPAGRRIVEGAGARRSPLAAMV